MKHNIIGTYTTKAIPRVAQVIDDYLFEARDAALTVWGMADCDVTEVRKIIKGYNANHHDKISFTAFLITCYSRVVEKYKYPINTYQKRKRTFYTFDDVDVMTNIEKTLPNGIKKPLNYTVRKANEKTLNEINIEIQQAKQNKEISVSMQKTKTFNLIKLFPKLPRFFRRWYLRNMLKKPTRRKLLLGTVGMTAVGMLGKHNKGFGHGIFMTPHTASVAVAGIEKKPIVKENHIVIREILSLTFAFNHSIVDGGPATRFGTDFLYMVEKGCIDQDWCFKSVNISSNLNK